MQAWNTVRLHLKRSPTLVRGVRLSRRLYEDIRSERFRLRRFKNCHLQQRRCFIVGNGPSILKQDLTLLRNEITFVTNWFILHDLYEQISPTYLCVSDEATFRGDDGWLRLAADKTGR